MMLNFATASTGSSKRMHGQGCCTTPSGTAGGHAFASNITTLPPLRCLVYVEFDQTAGSRIQIQVPEPCLTQAIFSRISDYILPKPELWYRLIKINLEDYKVIGYPVGIQSKQYHRNRFLFSLVFLVDNVSDVDCLYEPIVKKLALYLRDLEMSFEYLSKRNSVAAGVSLETNPFANLTVLPSMTLQEMMQRIFEDINSKGTCILDVNPKTTIYLRIFPCAKNPVDVAGHMVPSLTRPLDDSDLQSMDVATQQVLSYVDGCNPIVRISDLAKVDLGVVKSTIANLQFYGVINYVPLFQYSNRYALTAKIHQLQANAEFQAESCRLVALEPRKKLPRFRDVFSLYASFRPGMTMRDWCLRMNPRSMDVDERKLVQFGVSKGCLRKVTGYPVWNRHSATVVLRSKELPFLKMCDGAKSLEDLCLLLKLPLSDLLLKIESNANITLLWK